MTTHPTLIVHNAKIHTGVAQRPEVQALAVTGRRIAAVGTNGQIRSLAGPATVVVDAGQRRIVPGLIDSHLHLVRGGLDYNLELRWDGVPSLAMAMRMLAEQVARTPSPQWVRVVGGFAEHQFAERRLPTLDELNQLAPDTPVFVMHLHDRALLNAAALRACGYTRQTPDPPGGHIAWDAAGEPTGMLLAAPHAAVLHAAKDLRIEEVAVPPLGAGEVEVRIGGNPIVLRDGAFFGEMALLDRRPRSADIVSVTPCTLLVLNVADFYQIAGQQPSLIAAIEAEAARRHAANIAARDGVKT